MTDMRARAVWPAIVLPFIAAATVLVYFDLRVRNEGFDLEMTAIDVLDRAA